MDPDSWKEDLESFTKPEMIVYLIQQEKQYGWGTYLENLCIYRQYNKSRVYLNQYIADYITEKKLKKGEFKLERDEEQMSFKLYGKDNKLLFRIFGIKYPVLYK